MRIDIVVALVKEQRHASTGVATVLDDSLGQYLDLVAWITASALEEGADAVSEDLWAPIDADDLLAVLVPAAVGDVGVDLPAQALSRTQAWVGSIDETVTVA